ncbi:hypothetical protein P3342_005155 [Pyrenophora teres f. teres]|nr:hypothetical protein P3342_005155 [Pyrenophora teres f. teres]
MADINKDLQDLAKSTTEDFYELLGVPFDANEAAIKKAYRKASIRYHPDKNPDNKDAADRFIYLGWARDILVDETLKGEYDRARTRRREKALHDDLLDSRHRKMKEDLERREYEAKGPLHHIQSLKRKRPEDLTEAERREIELPDLVKRLAADGKRRRLELGERMAKERRELYEKASSIATPKTPEPVTELSRTIKLAFTAPRPPSHGTNLPSKPCSRNTAKSNISWHSKRRRSTLRARNTKSLWVDFSSFTTSCMMRMRLYRRQRRIFPS